MGVTHKIKPEIRDFVLEQKNRDPSLSCRKLTALVFDNFKIELSKSSVNMIIKEAGLSAPLGRTPKKKRRHIAMPSLPILEETQRLEFKQPEAEVLRLALPEEEEKRQEEEARKAREEQFAQEEARRKSEEEAAQKAEEEKWARLAEEEKRAREESERATSHREEELEGAEKKGDSPILSTGTVLPNINNKTEPSLFSSERFPQIENTGIILLKAADYAVGASKLIAEAIKNRVSGAQGNLEDLVENLIYLPMLQEKAEKSAIDQLSGYLEKIENIKVMNLDISRIIASSLQEARCVKFILSDGANLYLDGQMYSVWSSPYIPYDFASPVNSLKKYLNKYLNGNSPFVIFNAPGYDMPSLEFFNLLAALDGKGNMITNLVIYGNKLEELEVLPVPQAKKRFFVFGVWPWQFTECRKVSNLGEFRNLQLSGQNKDLYIASIEMELRHPALGKQMIFNGCAVKTGLNEKTRLVILSNFDPAAKKAEDLAAIYFNHWPNLEEAFQDYSRKIELFTYTANSQRYFSAESLNLGLAQTSTVKDLFGGYLMALDAYVRWHFLPGGYEDKEFVVTKERFYNLIAQLSQKGESGLMSFVLPPAYPFDKDLDYLCRRINEKEVVLSGGLKLYLAPFLKKAFS